MKSILLTLAMLLSASHVAAEGPYVAKGWVWVDDQDKEGKWHLGAQDKRGHFVAGAIVGSWAYMYAEKHGFKHPEWWGTAAAFFIGWLKETHDIKRGSGTGERADILATGLGGVAGVGLVKIKIRF